MPSHSLARLSFTCVATLALCGCGERLLGWPLGADGGTGGGSGAGGSSGSGGGNPGAGGGAPASESACDNQVDDDHDGLVDCADPDCEARLCAGGATCTVGLCCSAGSQACAGACIPSTACCAASDCPQVANGNASCDAGLCAFACHAGFHTCGGACAANDDVASCGSACTPCAPPLNAHSTCDGGACDFDCNPGYHACGGACAWDRDVATCGSACSPCTPPANADATCDGSACGYRCRPGFHDCGGTCMPDDSPNSCGASCTPCAAPANSSATCPDALSCGIACDLGFHLCNGQCVSDVGIAHCGASCTACVPPANSTSTCDGTACGYSCLMGFHDCSGTCQDNNSISSCGASCAACAPPANATATCNGSTCGYTCNSGFHDCGGVCRPNNSIASCGASCTACAPPANATATCNGTSCGFTCNSGYKQCGGACVPLAWCCSSGDCTGLTDTCITATGQCQCGSGPACGVASDRCTAGVCKCGAAASCSGNADTCTAAVCRCGAGAACTGERQCTTGQCTCAQPTWAVNVPNLTSVERVDFDVDAGLFYAVASQVSPSLGWVGDFKSCSGTLNAQATTPYFGLATYAIKPVVTPSAVFVAGGYGQHDGLLWSKLAPGSLALQAGPFSTNPSPGAQNSLWDAYALQNGNLWFSGVVDELAATASPNRGWTVVASPAGAMCDRTNSYPSGVTIHASTANGGNLFDVASVGTQFWVYQYSQSACSPAGAPPACGCNGTIVAAGVIGSSITDVRAALVVGTDLYIGGFADDPFGDYFGFVTRITTSPWAVGATYRYNPTTNWEAFIGLASDGTSLWAAGGSNYAGDFDVTTPVLQKITLPILNANPPVQAYTVSTSVAHVLWSPYVETGPAGGVYVAGSLFDTNAHTGAFIKCRLTAGACP